MLRNKFADLHFNQIASNVLFHHKRTREKKTKIISLYLNQIGTTFWIHSEFYKTDVKKQVCWTPLQSDRQQRIVSPHKNEKVIVSSLNLNQIGTFFVVSQKYKKSVLKNKSAGLHFDQIASNILFHRIRTSKNQKLVPST